MIDEMIHGRAARDTVVYGWWEMRAYWPSKNAYHVVRTYYDGRIEERWDPAPVLILPRLTWF